MTPHEAARAMREAAEALLESRAVELENLLHVTPGLSESLRLQIEDIICRYRFEAAAIRALPLPVAESGEIERLQLKNKQYQDMLDDKWAGIVTLVNDQTTKLKTAEARAEAERAVVEAAKKVRDLWTRQPVGNTPEWHAAVLKLVQAVDAAPEVEE